AVPLQACLQRPRLLFGESAEGRSAANHLVVVADLLRAGSGDEPGQSAPPQARKRKINNVGITKEVVKERLDRFQRFRPAKLEENNSYPTLDPCHPGDPKRRPC